MDLGKLLSICIPTYNRGEYLHECLNSLIPWVKDKGLPIYVVDDCSTDCTAKVVSDAQEAYGGIHYKRNSQNLGIYLNTLKVVSSSETEYVWLLGDDDRVITDDLDTILEYIEQGFEYIVLNSVAYNSSMDIVKKLKIIKCDDDIEYGRGTHEKLLCDLSTWAYHGFMSSMIARKEILINDDVPYSQKSFTYYKNNWLPLIMFYRGIVGKRGIFKCKPSVENRADNRYLKKTFWELSIIGRIKALESLKNNGYSKTVLRRAIGLGTTDIAYFAVNSRIVNKELTLCNKYVRASEIINIRFKILTFFIDHIPHMFLGFASEMMEKVKL